jgi:hypothetical protein
MHYTRAKQGGVYKERKKKNPWGREMAKSTRMQNDN